MFPIESQGYERNMKLRETLEYNLYHYMDLDKVSLQSELARRIAEDTGEITSVWEGRVNRFCSPSNPQKISDEYWELICKQMPELKEYSNV